MGKKRIIVVHTETDYVDFLKVKLFSEYEIITKTSVKMLAHEVQLQLPICIIIYLGEKNMLNKDWTFFLKKFPTIPCIAIMNNANISIAHSCGLHGINRVLLRAELYRIDKIIEELHIKNESLVQLAEISIDKTNDNYSLLIRDALTIIENNYIQILNIQEISVTMKISECTVSREFAKYQLPSPKKMLMFLKVRHAIKLMQNQGLRLHEIALMSGFTEEKRMSECFKRMYGISPGAFRKKQLEKLITE